MKWHIESVAISPDGKSIASGHWGGVTIWDAASGAERVTFQSHDAGCTGDVAYRPDGTSLAVTCRGSPVAHKDLNTVYVWDLSKGKDGLSDGKQQLRLKGHTDTVLKVAYSPDGKILATRGRSKNTKLWNATTGKELFNLATGFGQGVAFRPDGKVLATANEDDGVTLWEVATGQEVAKLASAVLPQSDIAFGPDGRTLVLVADDGSVRLWELPLAKDGKAKERFALKGHKGPIHALAFSPDGALLATGGGEDGAVRLWDAATGDEKAVLKRHGGEVVALAFGRDGKTLSSGGSDRMVHLWDVGREANRARGAAERAATQCRVIDVPTTERGYRELRSQVIDSQKDYEALVERLRRAASGADKESPALRALAGAKIDFDRESLVLIRHDEASDGTRVTVTPPTLDGDTLVCEVRRDDSDDRAAGGKERAEVTYCFALAVEKGAVKDVEVRIRVQSK